MKKYFIILSLFVFDAAVAGGGGGGGSSSCGRRVGDVCASCEDIGNTVWAAPGQIQICGPDKKWGPGSSVCADSRASTISAGMKWIKGGEDVSTQRCWKAACVDEDTYFIGSLATKAIDTSKCMPCDGKKNAKIVVEQDDTQIVFKIQKNTTTPGPLNADPFPNVVKFICSGIAENVKPIEGMAVMSAVSELSAKSGEYCWCRKGAQFGYYGTFNPPHSYCGKGGCEINCPNWIKE